MAVRAKPADMLRESNMTVTVRRLQIAELGEVTTAPSDCFGIMHEEREGKRVCKYRSAIDELEKK